MPYEMAGETAHEWIGMAIFILFILHHLMKRRWTGNIRKGRYTPVRIIQTVLAFVLLVLMIGSMVSGILLSRHIFRGVNIAGAANLARNVHMICAYWGFVLMAVHLGIHWNMFIGMLQKRSGTWIGKKLWALRILAFAIVAYGMHAFAGRDITGKSVEDMVYEAQRKVILELADKESCVIIGRNADFILKDRDDVLNVFIHGDMPEKIQRISRLYHVSDQEAAKLIEDTDKRRMTNYNFYTEQKWGKTSNYTLCLNSSQLGYDRCEAIIMECR